MGGGGAVCLLWGLLPENQLVKAACQAGPNPAVSDTRALPGSLKVYRLVGLVVQASASRVADPGFDFQ